MNASLGVCSTPNLGSNLNRGQWDDPLGPNPFDAILLNLDILLSRFGNRGVRVNNAAPAGRKNVFANNAFFVGLDQNPECAVYGFYDFHFPILSSWS